MCKNCLLISTFRCVPGKDDTLASVQFPHMSPIWPTSSTQHLTNFLSCGSFLALPDLRDAAGTGLAITLALMLDALRVKASKTWSHLKAPRGKKHLNKGNYILKHHRFKGVSTTHSTGEAG